MYVNIIYINKLLLFVWSTLKKEKEKKNIESNDDPQTLDSRVIRYS